MDRPSRRHTELVSSTRAVPGKKGVRDPDGSGPKDASRASRVAPGPGGQPARRPRAPTCPLEPSACGRSVTGGGPRGHRPGRGGRRPTGHRWRLCHRRRPPTTTTVPPPPATTDGGQVTYYDHPAGTCASPWLPFGTVVEVTNPANGESVSCVVNDREADTARAIDLATATFAEIAPLSQGVIDAELSW